MNYENITLEEHRSRTVGEILGLWENHDRVACVRYTGYGKTHFIVRKILTILKNSTFLILVPRDNLVNNYIKNFKDFANVKVQTYQYISRNDLNELKEEYINIDYIICDECHHLTENKWGDKLDKLISNLNVKTLGLTATPIRRDGVDVVAKFFKGVETTALDLLDGIHMGYVPKIDYVRALVDIPTKYDGRLSDVDRYKIKKLLNIPTILRKHIKEESLLSNYKILLFVSRVEYIQEAVEQCTLWFKEAFPHKNIKTYYMNSYETGKFNKIQKLNFETNDNKDDIDILISIDILNEGEHIPSVNTVIMLRKTSSYVVFNQQMGRAINNKQPLIFDLVNNTDYLYTNKNEYEIVVGNGAHREKVMFDDYCNLYDETVDIYDICYKYKIDSKYTPFLRKRLDYIKEQLNIKTISEIARELGVSPSVLTRFLVLHGLHTIQKRDDIPLYLKIEDRVRELIPKNMTLRGMAEEVGVNTDTIVKCIEVCKLDLPHKVKVENTKKERINYIQNNWRVKSKNEMCIDLKISVRTLDRLLKELKIKPKQIRVDDKKRAEMKKLYLKYKSVSKVATLLNVQHETVVRHLEQMGVYKRHKIPRALSIEYYEQFKDEITSKLRDGYSRTKITKEYGMTLKSLNKLLLLWGIERDDARYVDKQFETLKENILEDCYAGYSLRRLGKKYNVYGSTVKRYLIKWGYKVVRLDKENKCIIK